MKKKIIVYASVLIITLVSILGLPLNAEAAGECGDLDSSKCRVTQGRGRVVVSDGGHWQSGTYTRRNNYSAYGTIRNDKYVNLYSEIGVSRNNVESYFSAYYDSISSLYCFDAQLPGGADLYAERFLLSDPDGFILIRAMDYAIMSVLTDGGNNPINSLSTSNIADYWSRLVAIRALIYAFRQYEHVDNEYRAAFYANMTVLYNWVNDDSSLNTLYNNVSNALVEYHGSSSAALAPISTFSYYSSYNFTGEPVNRAKEYFVQALNDALEYIENAHEQTTISETSTDSPNLYRTTTDQGVYVEQDVTHTITVSNLPNNGTNTFVINGITLDHEYTGLEYEITSLKIGDLPEITDASVINSLLGHNLLYPNSTYDFTEETEIAITVHFSGWESSTDPNQETLSCGDAAISYSIDGVYSSTTDNGQYGDYIAIVWYSGEDTQRFVSVDRVVDDGVTNTETPWSSEKTIYLVDACDCDDLIDACIAEIQSTGRFGDACQEVIDQDCAECDLLDAMCQADISIPGYEDPCAMYDEVCDAGSGDPEQCGTTVSNFDCCDAEDNHLIISTIDNHEVDITGPDPVACFVDQIDDQVAEHGGDASSDDIETLDDVGNSYKLTQNKYCVVSCKEDYIMNMPTAKLVNAGRYFTFSAAVDGTKTCYTNSINRELYNEDMIRIQTEILDAYNEWLKYNTAYNAVVNKQYETHSNYFTSYEPCHVCGEPPACVCCGSYKDCTHYSVSISYDRILYNENYNNGVVRITGTTNVEFTYNDDGGGSGSGCGSKCHDGSVSTLASNLYELREEQASRLSEAQEEYRTTIVMYANCSNDYWSSEMNYDPEIYYDYEEDYLAEHYRNYGEMNSTINFGDENYWYCDGTLGDSYDDCNGDSYRNYDDTLETMNYIYCTTDRGCQTDPTDVSNALYVKKYSEVDADYKPATLFYNIYPSGEIVPADDYENSGRDDGVAIENGLPVNLSTERGIYKYTVNMRYLGEFYDQNGDLGRLIGDRQDNAVINEDDYGDYVNSNGYVEYACSYLVNMGITDGTTIYCDFNTECTGDDCYADCIGPGCDYTCDGDNCVADCIGAGCIYDADAGTSLIERVVSLNNLFPNGTDSYNWNRDENAKALRTIDEIEEAGESIYEDDPILSVTITPEAARAIKSYNALAIENNAGGYSNNTLVCYDIGDYEEIACYSTFISNLLNGTVSYNNRNLATNLDVVNDRSLIMSNNYRRVRDDNTTYFTIWDGLISENDMLGPSWK